ncbi:hypothetical protein ABW19_dt0201793 [Dactylella cylindrospora]|nr:hypothetical protein ABW19_dt0201793 [Dactylella cylindrospora]
MEAKPASITPTATGAGETVVEAAATPIELLAEATQLAREALAHHTKGQSPHASKPSTPPPIASEPQAAVESTQESEVPGLTQASTAASQDIDGVDPPKFVQNVAGQGPKVVAPPLSIPKREDIEKETIPVQDKRDALTPVNENSPSDYMLISPATATTPHPNIGNKRTASGAIKGPSTSLPATPYQPSSASPRNGRERIGELSTQLRSRLSYAMIKMQNGLQGQTFDQVEHFIAEKRHNRLSQSPSTTANTPLIPSASIGSSYTASQALKRQMSAEGTSSGLGISLMPSPVPASPRVGHGRVGRHVRTTSDPSAMYLAPAANIASQNDPNYWVKPPPSPRSSHVRGAPNPVNPPADSFAARFQMSPARHLAPAAPIRHHARSSSGPQHHTLPTRRGKIPPPSLPKTFSNMSNMSSVSNISNAPTEVLSLADEPTSHSVHDTSSSAVRPHTPVRTTTLTMEQDAVESLMFLSSPGHSQHRGSRPASRSAASHQPQFQSQLIQQIWNGNHTDNEGDSFMGETGGSTIVDEDEIRLVEEDDELDRELDRERKNREYEEPDTDQELRKEVNGVNSSSTTVHQERGGQSARVKRVKTMEEMLSTADRADAASRWQYSDKSAAPVAPSPMLSR